MPQAVLMIAPPKSNTYGSGSGNGLIAMARWNDGVSIDRRLMIRPNRIRNQPATVTSSGLFMGSTLSLSNDRTHSRTKLKTLHGWSASVSQAFCRLRSGGPQAGALVMNG